MLPGDLCEGVNFHPCQPLHAGRSLLGLGPGGAKRAEPSGPPARSVWRHFLEGFHLVTAVSASWICCDGQDGREDEGKVAAR